jgi:hypothetical protein
MDNLKHLWTSRDVVSTVVSMKTKLMPILATLAIAATSYAELGETLPQLKQRFKGATYDGNSALNGEPASTFILDKDHAVLVVLKGGVSFKEIYFTFLPGGMVKTKTIQHREEIRITSAAEVEALLNRRLGNGKH